MNIFKCIEQLYPNLQFFKDFEVRNDGDGDYLVWKCSNIAQPTQAQLQQVWLELEAGRITTQYQRDRLTEYPEIGEQLDLIYKDQLNGTTIWQDKITEIKNKYPKPE